MKVKEKEEAEAEALAEQEMQQSKIMISHSYTLQSDLCTYSHTCYYDWVVTMWPLILRVADWFCSAEEKRPKAKKPKVEFPVYEPNTIAAFVPIYDQGISIDDIEDQMDDWLEGKKQQKKVSVCLCSTDIDLNCMYWINQWLVMIVGSRVDGGGSQPALPLHGQVSWWNARPVGEDCSWVRQISDWGKSLISTVTTSNWPTAAIMLLCI